MTHDRARDVSVLIHPHASLGESPRWHADERRLYWVDIDRCELHRTDPATGNDECHAYAQPVGCFAFRKEGGLVMAMKDGFALIDDWDDEPRPVGPQMMADRPHHRFNDGCTDASGRFYAGSLTRDKANADAALFRLDADGNVTELAGGMTTCNGAAFSPDGRHFYHADTPTHAIRRFDVDAATGAISNPTLFHQFVHGTGRPDGAAVDADGCVWSALFDGGRIVRLSPEGELLETVTLPVSRPTMISFGGDDLCTAFVTSATTGLTEQELADQPLAGAIFTFRVTVPGLASTPFAG